VQDIGQRELGTESVPKTIIGKHISIMNLLIVRTIVVRRTILFLLIKLMGKQIGTEHAGVEGFHILLGSTFHQHTIQ
jgi:hypothetical protein